MKRLIEALRIFHKREDGHAQTLPPGLLAAVGAIVLAVGAAEDSSVAAYIGGALLAVGILAMGVFRHQIIDYEIYGRLDKLEE